MPVAGPAQPGILGSLDKANAALEQFEKSNPSLARAQDALRAHAESKKHDDSVREWLNQITVANPEDLMTDEERDLLMPGVPIPRQAGQSMSDAITKFNFEGVDVFAENEAKHPAIFGKSNAHRAGKMDFAMELAQAMPGTALRLSRKKNPTRSDLEPIFGRDAHTSAADRQALSENLAAAMYSIKFGRPPEEFKEVEKREKKEGYQVGDINEQLARTQGSPQRFHDERYIDAFREHVARNEAKKARQADPERAAKVQARLQSSALEIGARSAPGFDKLDDAGKLGSINAARAQAGLEPLTSLPGTEGFVQVMAREWTTGDGLLRRTPIVGSLFEAGELIRTKAASERLAAGTDTLEDWDVLAEFQERLLRDVRGRTFWGEVASLASQSATFGGEMVVGGVAAGAMKAGAKKVAGKVAAKAIDRAVASRVGQLTSKIAQATLERTPQFAKTAGRIAGETALRMPTQAGTGLRDFEARRLGLQIITPADSDDLKAFTIRESENFRSALINAFKSTAIETGTELLGGEAIRLMPRSWLAKVQEKLAIEWMGANGKTYEQFTKWFEKAQWHGLVNEMGEERVADLLRYATGVTEQGGPEAYSEDALKKLWPGWRQLGVEAAAFSIPGVTRMGASSILNGIQSASTDKEMQAFLESAMMAFQPEMDPKVARDLATKGAGYVRKWSEAAEAANGRDSRYVPRPDPFFNSGFVVWDRLKDEAVTVLRQEALDFDSANEMSFRLNTEKESQELYENLEVESREIWENFLREGDRLGLWPVPGQEEGDGPGYGPDELDTDLDQELRPKPQAPPPAPPGGETEAAPGETTAPPADTTSPPPGPVEPPGETEPPPPPPEKPTTAKKAYAVELLIRYQNVIKGTKPKWHASGTFDTREEAENFGRRHKASYYAEDYRILEIDKPEDDDRGPEEPPAPPTRRVRIERRVAKDFDAMTEEEQLRFFEGEEIETVETATADEDAVPEGWTVTGYEDEDFVAPEDPGEPPTPSGEDEATLLRRRAEVMDRAWSQASSSSLGAIPDQESIAAELAEIDAKLAERGYGVGQLRTLEQELLRRRSEAGPRGDRAPKDDDEAALWSMSDQVAQRLRRGDSITNPDLDEMSRGVWGAATGHARDAYDAAEAGLNKILPDVLAGEEGIERVEALERITPRLVRQSKRDDAQVDAQQFSTPPAIGEIAVQAAGVVPGMVVLEPSAGTGSLASLALAAGAEVHVNEIDDRRLSLLRSLGFDPSAVNAQLLDSLLPSGQQFDAVVMNPPFSSYAGTGIKKSNKIGREHVRQAMMRVKPGGRLVAIVGQGTSLTAPSSAGWFARMRENYTLRADVGIPGRDYGKYGTTFPVRIQVWDNTGPTSESAPIISGDAGTLAEAHEMLSPLMKEDVHGRVRERAGEGGEAEGGESGGTGTGGGPGAGAGNRNRGKRDRGGKPGQGPGGGPGETAGDGADDSGGGTSTEGDAGGAGLPPEEPAGDGAGGTSVGGEGAGDGGGGGGTGSADDLWEQLGGLDIASKRPRRARRRVDPNAPAASEAPQPPATPDPKLVKIVAQLLLQAVKENPKATFEDIIEAGINKLGAEKIAKLGPVFERQWDIVSDRMGARFAPRLKTVTRIANDKELRDKIAEQHKADADTIFVPYEIRNADTGDAKPHPATFVETRSLSEVVPPKVTYTPLLPEKWIKEGWISNIQLELVMRAGQIFETALPSGERRGFVNGDGTGVGKTREALAIAHDQMVRGRTKAVFLTLGPVLVDDFVTKAEEIEFPFPVIRWKDAERVSAGKPKKKKGKGQDVAKDEGEDEDVRKRDPITVKDGILVGSYGTLSHDWDGSRARFNQLIEWLGPNFDGLIIFDESHKLKNAQKFDDDGNPIQDAGSKVGIAAIALQEMFPQARILMQSATMATEAKNLSAYSRLGLWGVGAPFRTISDFIMEMQKHLRSGLEQLARDLRAMGSYLSRQISYAGVDVVPVNLPATPSQKHAINTLAAFWNEAYTEFFKAQRNIQNQNMRANNRWKGVFYGAQLNFFGRVMASLKAEAIIPDIRRYLAEGYTYPDGTKEPVSIIVSLVNTGEADQDRAAALAQGLGISIGELEINPREIIRLMIERQFPTVGIDPQTRQSVTIQENVRARDALMAKLAAAYIPENALDLFHRAFGREAVAEISGRAKVWDPITQSLVDRKPPGVPGNSLNNWERNQFMDGKKHVLLITGAGSAGIDAHASLAHKNQRRRLFYSIQPFWSADAQMQAMGRGHRSNQRSAPIMALVSLDLASDRRVSSVTSARLKNLGATSSGERRAAGAGLFTGDDILSDDGKAAVDTVIQEVINGQHEDKGLTGALLLTSGMVRVGNPVQNNLVVAPVVSGAPEKFLNRLMSLQWDQQNALFDAFMAVVDRNIAARKAAGLYDWGTQDIRATGMVEVVPERVVYEDLGTEAQTKFHVIEGDVQVKKVEWHEAELIGTQSGFGQGWVRRKRDGKVFAVVKSSKSQSINARLVPVAGSPIYQKWLGVDPQTDAQLDESFEKLDRKDARTAWMAAYDASPGTEKQTFYIVSGLIFPIYDRVVGSGVGAMPNIEPVRAALANGRVLTGLRVNETDLPGLRRRLGITDTVLQRTDGAALLRMLQRGATAKFDNGWEARAGTANGERVVELFGAAAGAIDEDHAKDLGWIKEIIRHRERWLVPWGDAADVLDATMKAHPLVSSEEDLSSPPTGPPPAAYARQAFNVQTSEAAENRANDPAASVQPSPSMDAAWGYWNKDFSVYHRLPNPDVEPVGWWELIARLEDVWNVSIRHGRTRDVRRAAGYYRWYGSFNPSIRMAKKWARSLDTLAHEIGHQADFLLHRVTAGMPNTAELDELVRLDYDYPKAQRRWEGFAEFFRLLMTSDKAETAAPLFYRWFWDQFIPAHPIFASRLAVTKDLFDRYMSQGATQRAIADMESAQKPSKMAGETLTETFADKLSRFFTTFRGDFEDTGVILKNMAKAMKKQGVDVPPGSNPYMVYDAQLRRARVYAEDALTGDGVVGTTNNTPLYRSMKEVFSRIRPGERKQFAAYYWARQAQEALDYGIDPGMTREDADQIMLDVRNDRDITKQDRFAITADQATEYNNALLWVLVDAGRLTPQEAQKMIAFWRFYAPLIRPPVGAKRYGPNKLRVFDVRSVIKRRRGSPLPIVDPIESMIQRTIDIYSQAARQQVVNAIFRSAYHKPLIGASGNDPAAVIEQEDWVRRIPEDERGGKLWVSIVAPSVKPMKIPAQEVIDQIAKEGNIGALKGFKVPADLVVRLWRTSYDPEPGKHIVAGVYGGQRVNLQLDPDLHEMLTAVDQPSLPGFLNMTIGNGSRLLKLFATGLAPGFQLVNLFIHDFVTYQFQGSKPGLKPFKALALYVLNETLGRLGWLRKNEQVELYKKYGVWFSSLLAADRTTSTRRAGERVFASTAGRKLRSKLRHPVWAMMDATNAARSLLGISEVPARLAEMMNVLDRHGYTEAALRAGAVPDRDAMIESMFASGEVTTPFHRGGRYRQALELVPFQNAQIQAFAMMLRTARYRPIQVLLTALATAATTAAYWWFVRDLDVYKRMAAYLKYGSWGVFDDSGKMVAKFPRGQGWAWLVSSTSQAILDQFFGDDPEAINKAAPEILSNVLPFGDTLVYHRPPAVALVSPAIDIASNKDPWGRKIVDDYMSENRVPDDQYHPYTTRSARHIAGFVNKLTKGTALETNVSPIEVEYFLNQASGGGYRAIFANAESFGAWVTDDPTRRVTPWPDMPVASRFAVRRDYTDTLNTFYERKARLQQEVGSARAASKDAEAPADLLVQQKHLERTARLMGAIRKELKDVTDRDIRFEMGEKYIEGLAGSAVGLKPLKRYPTPYQVPNVPSYMIPMLDKELSSLADAIAAKDVDAEELRRQKRGGRWENETEQKIRVLGARKRQREIDVNIDAAFYTLEKWGIRKFDLLIDALRDHNATLQRPEKDETLDAKAERIKERWKKRAKSRK